MENYNHPLVEEKWQFFLKKNNIFRTKINKSKKKFYCLEMFPYPSGSGLHCGHWYNYALADSYCRYLNYIGVDKVYVYLSE